MLHIILLILKIIGIVLLCIIGIVILALVCVLFVPVRYRIEVTREEGEDQPPVVVRMKVTWLLHLLNIFVRYPAETIVRVRILFFTILRMPDKKASKDKETEKKKPAKKKDTQIPKKEDKTTKEDKTGEEENRTAKGDEPEKTDSAGQNETAKTARSCDGPDKIPTVTIKAMKPEEDETQPQRSPSFMDKIRALPVIIKKIFEKIKSLFENIQYTIRRFCDRIKSISDKIQYYKEIVESDSFQNAFGLCKGELTAILKSLKPQKVEAELIVGMDDPATTAKILSVCGMLYPVLAGHVNVVGDFERKRVEGFVFVKGKIRFFTFLRAAVRIYFNKDVKRLLKLLKKEAV